MNAKAQGREDAKSKKPEKPDDPIRIHILCGLAALR
jgi:hypothetical protein